MDGWTVCVGCSLVGLVLASWSTESHDESETRNAKVYPWHQSSEVQEGMHEANIS